MFSIVLFLVVFTLLCWYFYPQRPEKIVGDLKADIKGVSKRLDDLEERVNTLDIEIDALANLQIAQELERQTTKRRSFMTDFWG